MPTNLLILPLLGGYWFLHKYYDTRMRAYRLDGYRLLLDSAIWGLFFAALARLLVGAASFVGLREEYRAKWVAFAVDQPYFASACLAFLIALPAPYICNAINAFRLRSKGDPLDELLNIVVAFFSAPRRGNRSIRSAAKAFLDPARSAAVTKVVQEWGSELDIFLDEAASTTGDAGPLLVMVTLRTRKVYVGWILRAPDFRPADDYFSLFPVFSGYRGGDELQLVLTTYYPRAMAIDKTHSLAVRAPRSAIESATFFDMATYLTHFRGTVPGPSESGERPGEGARTGSVEASS